MSLCGCFIKWVSFQVLKLIESLNSGQPHVIKYSVRFFCFSCCPSKPLVIKAWAFANLGVRVSVYSCSREALNIFGGLSQHFSCFQALNNIVLKKIQNSWKFEYFFPTKMSEEWIWYFKFQFCGFFILNDSVACHWHGKLHLLIVTCAI